MSRRGKKKMPAVTKKGNSETSRQLNERAAMEQRLMGNDDKVYEIPDYLDELEQAYYSYLTTELKAIGTISNIDIGVVEETAICLSDLQKLNKIIRSEGIIVESIDRYGHTIKKENTAFTAKQKLLKEFRAFTALLGMNPSARAQLAGMKIQAKEESADPLLKILNRGKSNGSQ